MENIKKMQIQEGKLLSALRYFHCPWNHQGHCVCTCFYHFIRNKPALLKTLAGSQSELYRIFVPAGGTEGRRAVISTLRILRGKGEMESSEERRESYCLEGFMRTNVRGSWCGISGVNLCSTVRFYHRVLRWHFKET